MIKKNLLKDGGIILTYLTELPNEMPIEMLNEINHYIKYSIYKQITDAIQGLLDIKFKKEDDIFKKIYKGMYKIFNLGKNLGIRERNEDL